jgi:hypothetical protein
MCFVRLSVLQRHPRTAAKLGDTIHFGPAGGGLGGNMPEGTSAATRQSLTTGSAPHDLAP